MMRKLLTAATAAVLAAALGFTATRADPLSVPANPTAEIKPTVKSAVVGPPAAHRIAPLSRATEIEPTGRAIVLAAHKGVLVRLPRPAGTIFIADPAVADVSVQSPSVLYVKAINPGETALYALDADQNVLLSAPVRVVQDLGRLRRALRVLAPGDDIHLAAVDNSIVLTGAVASATEAEKVRTLAAQIAGETGGSIINRLVVTTPNQVYLRVKVAEVNRTVLKELGINWQKLAGNLQFVTPGAPADALASSFLQLGLGAHNGRTQATLAALEQEGLLTTLAEPNLTAVSGHPASFLAGGVFYIPVPQPSGTGSGTPFVTAQPQNYGVQLQFTPTVIDADHVSLTVRPEVSELTTQGSVTIDGTTIPGLSVRRAETTVELASGDSFALAGLLQNNVTQTIRKFPGLGDIPILGQLFRSEQFQRNETELVIIVTVYLVQPSETRLATPVDGFVPPSDAQRVMNGDLYRQRLPVATTAPLGPSGQRLVGPVGFQLD